ncbi:hypothetical protein FHT82_005689 [Rhizobium sp. BK275]|nr:hypothetical protein [Rhizobium sp. BK275]
MPVFPKDAGKKCRIGDKAKSLGAEKNQEAGRLAKPGRNGEEQRVQKQCSNRIAMFAHCRQVIDGAGKEIGGGDGGDCPDHDSEDDKCRGGVRLPEILGNQRTQDRHDRRVCDCHDRLQLGTVASSLCYLNVAVNFKGGRLQSKLRSGTGDRSDGHPHCQRSDIQQDLQDGNLWEQVFRDILRFPCAMRRQGYPVIVRATRCERL